MEETGLKGCKEVNRRITIHEDILICSRSDAYTWCDSHNCPVPSSKSMGNKGRVFP